MLGESCLQNAIPLPFCFATSALVRDDLHIAAVRGTPNEAC
jgi:hypothetical protein